MVAIDNNAQPTDVASTLRESYDQPVVGLILPPPEIRSIVDKTASFVARNGEQFEQKIKQEIVINKHTFDILSSNSKFNFLKDDDPYNVYYKKKVKDFSEGTATLVKQDENVPVPVEVSQKPKIIIPTEPPVEFEFCHDPPTMNALELDIVKLTAQFVARNGRSFLTQLMQKEAKNYQFDFLRPQHTLFQYFSKLVEQYNKVLIPSKTMRQKLRHEMTNQQLILNDVNYRAEWGRYQERIRKQEQEKQEKERVAYAEIDWHDFVIVETVDFPLHERADLPPPVTKEQLGVRMARIMRLEESAAEETEQQQHQQPPVPVPAMPAKQTKVIEHDLGQEVQDVPAAPPKPMEPKESAPPVQREDIVVRSDYNPKNQSRTKVNAGDVEYLISPLTGVPIPASKMAEHMKIGLLDPSWVEQRKSEIQKKKDEEDYYAQDASVVNTLASIARFRTDIFGVEGEAGIGRQVDEDQTKARIEQIGWDGHKRTAGSAVAERMQSDNAVAKERMNMLNRGVMPDDLKDASMGAPGPQKQPQMPIPGAPTAPRMIPLVRQVVPQPVVPVAIQQRHHMQQPQMMVPQQGVMMGGVGMQIGMRPGAPMGMRPMMPGQHSATMPGLRPPLGSSGMEMAGGPPAKKARPEETLIPEDQFLRSNPTNVSFQVSVPKVEKDDWNCRGQLIHVSMPLTTTFADVKSKIESETGMPPAKQKLQCEGVFVKDSNSLAFYNIRPSSLILMTLKERGGRKRFVTAYKKSIFIVITPILLLPLLFQDELTNLSPDDLCTLYKTDTERCDQTIARIQQPGNEPTLYKCTYVVVLMVVYWCFEAAPLPATALIPLFAYPFLGVVTAKTICASYFKDVIVLFLGGLTLAIAIEVWNLHKRIALFVLTKVGAKPVWLLAGFMFTTSFISMWMSNVATTAMMAPIAQAVLVQLKETHEDSDKDKPPTASNGNDEENSKLLNRSDEREILNRMYNGLCKALLLGIAYCASIGGIGMLTGTGPNLITANQAMDKYSYSINFVNWAAYATPLSILMTFVAWGTLSFFFLMDKDRNKVDNEKQVETASRIIKDEYYKLGQITFPEKMIVGNFILLLILWLTRAPGGAGTGWSVYFKDGYLSDGSSAILVAFLLFVLPAEPPFQCDMDGNYKVSLPLITWKQMASKMGWGVIFLLGGGFAMAAGITSSGLGQFIGLKMSGLSGISSVLMMFLCCLVINIMTQVTSNSSTMMIFAAVLCDMAENLSINPMYLMVPCAASVSMAFCLPVSTPPNAVIFEYGYLTVGEMIKVGIPLSLIGAVLSAAMIHVLGGLQSVFDIWNVCPDYIPNEAACHLIPATMALPTLDVNVTVS